MILKYIQIFFYINVIHTLLRVYQDSKDDKGPLEQRAQRWLYILILKSRKPFMNFANVEK